MTEPPPTPASDASVDPWEAWAKTAVVLAIIMVLLWVVVFMRFGITSVAVLAAIPYLGAATLIVLAWGLVRTVLNPPVLRRSRTIAFLVLLGAGFIGTEPLIPAPLSTEDYRTSLTYELPVRGEWMTLAGGLERDRNYHATFPPVRWAYDFTKVADGKKFRLDGGKTTDWLCFGEPVYAPVDGKIIQLQSHHVDNNPGEVSPTSVIGNHVVIEAAPAEFVYLSHLKKGSVSVKLDQVVRRGEQIGACGNSGQSPEPHVHMHVQDRPEFPVAQGLPIGFSNYTANKKPVEHGMPRGASAWEELDGELVEHVGP